MALPPILRRPGSVAMTLFLCAACSKSASHTDLLTSTAVEKPNPSDAVTSAAESPESLTRKESSFDGKPALVAAGPNGQEIHYRQLGPEVWVGREAVHGKETGRWHVVHGKSPSAQPAQQLQAR